ncbi:MAG: YceI family protein [Actinomycetota bacterium]|nr:YceI family protein [Actinomycetota bacterium]
MEPGGRVRRRGRRSQGAPRRVPATSKLGRRRGSGGEEEWPGRRRLHPLDGTWRVTAGSRAGYRVKEVLFGQDAEALGRTDDVTGAFDVRGTSVAAGWFSVDMTTVTSDESRRDNQFRGRIMVVATYPTATSGSPNPSSSKPSPPTVSSTR